MFEYQAKVVQDVAACTCDRCHRRMTPVDFEWQEKLSVSFHGSYGSIFGDGNKVEIDLCPQCVEETLGAWLRISHSEWGDLIERGIDDSDAGQGYPADSRPAPRAPGQQPFCTSLRAGRTPHCWAYRYVARQSELLQLHGKLNWQGDLDAMRRDDDVGEE
ncbi:hypothetical protein [Paraburkholderia guartelaensis]|uniref:hypothetical protein n=1 Tax=Paraburkholderia guartelaensis TaxID=2546446 RepID=UPI002AB60DF0|nr:hypothetical protein [Paraburkholderia guartelaensis]